MSETVETMLIGVDEAGRGPVLGSMFVAAFAVSGDLELPCDVDDSKTIPAERRPTLAGELRALDGAKVAIAEVEPKTIDDGNLNTLTILAAADVIQDVLDDGGRGVRCFVDACDVDVNRFARRLGERLPAGIDIVAAHRADANEPIVGAASILAKEAREAHVASLSEHYGAIGSGYAHDPTTRSFLREYLENHGEIPSCARRSWSTCERLLAQAEQETLPEFG